MKKIVCGIISILFSSAAFCQSVPWTLTEVKDKTDIAGYIYHTESLGTQYGVKNEKIFTSLRFACSPKSSAPPLIIIMWDSPLLKGSSTQLVYAIVDNKIIPSYDQWDQDENIVYKPIHDTDVIMQQLKIGNVVTFTWTDNSGIRLTTAFDLQNMKKGLIEFNKVCNTHI
jgi:hypothetical protein